VRIALDRDVLFAGRRVGRHRLIVDVVDGFSQLRRAVGLVDRRNLDGVAGGGLAERENTALLRARLRAGARGDARAAGRHGHQQRLWAVGHLASPLPRRTGRR